MKEKLSSEKVAEILGQVGPALRHLSQKNQELTEKVARYEKKERVEKIASQMQEKNLSPDTSYDETWCPLLWRVHRLMWLRRQSSCLRLRSSSHSYQIIQGILRMPSRHLKLVSWATNRTLV